MTSAQIAHLIESSSTTKTIYRSRVYGYCIAPDKPVEIVPREAEVIRRVFLSDNLDALADELQLEGIKNRLGRPFTANYLKGLIRNYYTGSEGIYPQIVTESEYRTARRSLTSARIVAPRG
jgi:hypothetical protein